MSFLSGDNLNLLSNVSIYERNYYNHYIKNSNIISNVIFVNENNSQIMNSIKGKKTIFFTKIEYLSFFIREILPILNEKFILITHYGDLNSGDINILLNHKLLSKWYGLNMSVISNKTEGLPIGLENKYWGRTNFDKLILFSENKKHKLCYLNFSLNTNSRRKEIMDKIIKNGFSKNETKKWIDYIEDLSQYKFAICPDGNGVDTHRAWECLYLGVIPIISESVQMSFFSDLPILYLKNFDNVTPKFLDDIYEEKFKDKNFNLEKLDISYWKNKIKKDL